MNINENICKVFTLTSFLLISACNQETKEVKSTAPPPVPVETKLVIQSPSPIRTKTPIPTNEPTTNPIKKVVDLTNIIAKSPEVVESILGKHDEYENTKHGEKRQYQSNQIEIMFINGKADWITINGMNEYQFESESIKYLGLDSSIDPTTKNTFTLKWENYPEIKSIQLFENGSGMIDYAYIKAKTK